MRKLKSGTPILVRGWHEGTAACNRSNRKMCIGYGYDQMSYKDGMWFKAKYLRHNIVPAESRPTVQIRLTSGNHWNLCEKQVKECRIDIKYLVQERLINV